MEETVTVTVTQYIKLPDGSYAALIRTMDYGDVVLLLFLTAFFFLRLVELWQRGRTSDNRTARAD